MKEINNRLKFKNCMTQVKNILIVPLNTTIAMILQNAINAMADN